MKIWAAVLLTFQISTCINPGRMVRYYTFQESPDQITMLCQSILDSLGYEIDIFLPDQGFILTKEQLVKNNLTTYSYTVIIKVEDVISVYLSADQHIFKRGSESSIGGKSLIEKNQKDRLPFGVQEKIYFPISEYFLAHGFKEFDREQIE